MKNEMRTHLQSQPVEDQGIPVDGFGQIVELIQAADPTFRASLIRRIAERDPNLFRKLKQALTGSA